MLKKALVYSVKDNTVKRMTRGALAKRRGMSIIPPISLFHHSGLTLTAKQETDFVSKAITIPKGAIRMDITSDALEPQVDENVDGNVSRSSSFDFGRKMRQSKSNLVASVHIPSHVYWLRVLDSSRYTELFVVSPKTTPENTPVHSRNNTSNPSSVNASQAGICN